MLGSQLSLFAAPEAGSGDSSDGPGSPPASLGGKVGLEPGSTVLHILSRTEKEARDRCQLLAQQPERVPEERLPEEG